MKRFVRWAVVLGMFGMFATLVLTATGANARSEAQAVSMVSSTTKPGQVIVVSNATKNSWFNKMVGVAAKEEVCWVSPKQFRQVAARWHTTLGSHSTAAGSAKDNYAKVTGASLKSLRQYVSGSVKCVAVEQRYVFFLPIDGGLS